MPRLWCVSVARVLPAARSQSRTVLSAEPETTCGSVAAAATLLIVAWWPPSIMTCFDVRWSQQRTQLSRPPVKSRSSVGCSARQ